MIKKALIGLHYEGNLEAFRFIAEMQGYEVITTNNQEELERILENQEFSRVLQDANLGSYGAITIKSAERTYKILKEKIEKELVKFFAISGKPETIDLLNERGIPGEDKSNFSVKATEFFD